MVKHIWPSNTSQFTQEKCEYENEIFQKVMLETDPHVAYSLNKPFLPPIDSNWSPSAFASSDF